MARRFLKPVLAALAAVVWSTQAAAAPDWSGWWSVNPPWLEAYAEVNPPPWKPAEAEVYRKAAELALKGGGGQRFCQPPPFTGFSQGIVGAVEFLNSPNRITLITEDSFVRRIYLPGFPIPATPDPSITGLSLGHWEGDTLVVETTNISPDVAFPFPFVGGPRLGPGAKVTERIAQDATGRLVFDVVTTAPAILTGPYRQRFTYRRIRPGGIGVASTICTSDDREVDPATGENRMDLTPPADLPPPPG